MKEYISRLRKGTSDRTFIFWWIMRIAVVAAFVGSFFSDNITVGGQIHIALCFVLTFMWELSMVMSPKSLFRLLPASIHTAINVGLAISAVGGIYFNLYNDLRLFDPLLAAYFGFISVLYGYEIGYAVVKRDHYAATKAMVFYAAFGVSFILLNVWEVAEFCSDQLFGLVTGEAGNTQFWSEVLSAGTDRAESIIPAIDPGRYPLMDIMADIVIHTASAFAALIFINIFPYRLRGKYRYDIEFGNNDVKKTEKVIN